MAEERTDDGGEDEKRSSHRNPLSPTPRKLLPFKKKTKDCLPLLSNCHCCGLHFPSKPRNGTSLQTLESQWRIVLLCDQCLRRIRSAAVCSYCFSEFPSTTTAGAGAGELLDCRECSCRVHAGCVPKLRPFVCPSDLHPECFVCVDCSVLPRSRTKNSSSVYSRAMIEDLMREAKKKASAAVRAKEKAVEKARVAKHAAELASKALDALVVERDPDLRGQSVVKDEELALQLHRAMNGSQRISRSGRSGSSDRLIDPSKVQGSRTLGKVEFCMEDKGFFESWSSSAKLDSNERKEVKKEIDGHSESSHSPVDVIMKEEEGSCSNKVVNPVGEDDSISSVLVSCQRAIDSLELQKKCDSKDRYMMKYSKRKSNLKEMTNKESRLVPC